MGKRLLKLNVFFIISTVLWWNTRVNDECIENDDESQYFTVLESVVRNSVPEKRREAKALESSGYC